MNKKMPLKYRIIDFKLATQPEISKALGQRLKAQRILKKLKQEQLAARAGVATGTIKNLEGKGQSTLETLVRVVMALGLTEELSNLFSPQATSISQMEAMEKTAGDVSRRRVR